MNDDDLGRLLGEAFDAHARAAGPDSALPPAPRFEQRLSSAPKHAKHSEHADRTDEVELAPIPLAAARRRRRWVAPLSAAVAVAAAVTIGVVVADAVRGGDHRVDSATVTKADADAQPVHVKLLNSDGAVYGTGMPVIAYFSRRVTDARAFQAATHVTVDGKPLTTAWYFEPSSAGHGPLEAHLRPYTYWPAHATVHVSIDSKGAAAGKGLGFQNSLTLDFRTGSSTTVQVDGATHTLTVTTDHTSPLSCTVALGAAQNPTSKGVKVIMDKHPQATLSGQGQAPTYKGVTVHYVQRLTYGGEYLLAVPDDLVQTNHGQLPKTSSGSTDMTTGCARKLYKLTRIGDVVTFQNTGGPAMQLGAGYGDWGTSWGTWLTGGAAPTR